MTSLDIAEPTASYLFWGGYGGDNLGDEAILWAMSQLLRQFDAKAAQYVLLRHKVSPQVEAQYRAWGIEPVYFKSGQCLSVLGRARLIVGGGQMVDDNTYGWPVGWSSIFLVLNRLFGQRSLVLCIGAEPLTKPIHRFLVRWAYGLAAAVTCRDEESSAAVRKAGIPADCIRTTREVVFSLDRSTLPQWAPLSSAERTIAVVVAYDPNRVTEDLNRYWVLVQGLRQAGMSLLLLAHDLRSDYDVRAVREVKAVFAEDELVSISHPRSVAEAFELYSRVDAVVSARMHPLIMGLLAGTLPIAFGGKSKVRSLLANSDIPSINPMDSPAMQVGEIVGHLDRRMTLLPMLAATAASFRSNVEETMRSVLMTSGRKGQKSGA